MRNHVFEIGNAPLGMIQSFYAKSSKENFEQTETWGRKVGLYVSEAKNTAAMQAARFPLTNRKEVHPMAIQIRKAQRSLARLKLGIAGPSGSGKT